MIEVAEPYAAPPERARKNLSLILQRLASAGQKAVGEEIGKSESWVSRWKADDAETFACLLAALRLKVVDADAKCYAADYIDHLAYFARRGMDGAPPALEWDDGGE